MSDEAPWLPLNDAATRCQRAGVSETALNDILQSGRVPLRGKRDGRVRADPIELPHVREVRISPALNEIILAGSSELDRLRASYSDVLRPTFNDAQFRIEDAITFTDVVVHWPKLVEELQSAGFKLKARRQKSTRSLAVTGTTPATASALPRPTLPDDNLRTWYEKQVEKDDPTSEAADWAAARVKFGARVRRDQVRQIRRELAPEAWRQQGRRRKAGNPPNNSAE